MKRILVAIDFSEVTPPVIHLARQLAKALTAEIHLVHVREITAAPMAASLGYGLAGMPELAPMTGVPVAGFEPMLEAIAETEDEKSRLVRWQAELAQEGFTVTWHEPTG